MIWKSKFNQIIVQLADFITAITGFILSCITWKIIHPIFPSLIPSPIIINDISFLIIIILSIFFVVLLKYYGAYRFQRFTSLTTEWFIVLKVSIIEFFVSIVFVYLVGFKQTPRTIYIVSFFVILVLFIIQKTFMFYLARYIRKHKYDRKRVILFGTGKRSKQFIETVENNFDWGLDIVGLITCDKDKIGKDFYGKPVIDSHENIEQVLKNINPQEVIITVSTRNFSQIRKVFEVCEREGIQVRLNSDFFSKLSKNIKVDTVYGLNIISFHKLKHNEYTQLIKRVFDIVGALIAIILFSPLMIIAAIGILIKDGRPIFYPWNVVGLDKKPIKSWKFRTMVKNADELKKDLINENEMNGPVFKIANDPRILPFGKWLRKWSIDETPQLFSVLRGDLSLVGPRPPLQSEFDEFDSWHRRKLSVKPGLTCFWQISGRNVINDFNKWAELDLKYIDNWSIWLDLKILLLTIPAIIKGSGK